MENKFIIGSHVSMNGSTMFLGSAKEAESYGENAFMVYTGAPQNTRRKPISELRADEGKAYEGTWYCKYRCSCALYY